jgi:rhodanese-related sulfurtransferase
MPIAEVTPAELRAELDAGKKLFLVDVREDHELKISKLEGIVHIPQDELSTRFEEIPMDSDVVVICRTGGRSGRACEFLAMQGYTRMRNLVTGMNGYAETVDTSMPTY